MVNLKSWLRKAIKDEQEGKEEYLKMAELFKKMGKGDTGWGKIFTQMANDEGRHKKSLQRLLKLLTRR